MEYTRATVSALGMGAANHFLQNRESPDISKALRLPIRVKNMTRAALATNSVGMRGSDRRSVMVGRTTVTNCKIFSE